MAENTGKKGGNTWLIVGALALLGVGFYFWWKSRKSSSISSIIMNFNDINKSQYPNLTDTDIQGALDMANKLVESKGVEDAISELKIKAQEIANNPNASAKDKQLALLYNDIAEKLGNKNSLKKSGTLLNESDFSQEKYPTLTENAIKEKLNEVNGDILKFGLQATLEKLLNENTKIREQKLASNYVPQIEKNILRDKDNLNSDARRYVQKKIDLENTKNQIPLNETDNQTITSSSTESVGLNTNEPVLMKEMASTMAFQDPFFIDKADYQDNTDTPYEGLNQQYIDSNIDRVNNLVKTIGVEATIAQLTAEYTNEPDNKKAEFLKELTAFLDIANGGDKRKYNYRTEAWYLSKLKAQKSVGLLSHYMNVWLGRGNFKELPDNFLDKLNGLSNSQAKKEIPKYFDNLVKSNPNLTEQQVLNTWIDYNVKLNVNAVGKIYSGGLSGRTKSKNGKIFTYDTINKKFILVDSPAEMIAQTMVQNQVQAMSLGGIDMTSQKTKNAMMQQAMMQVKR